MKRSNYSIIAEVRTGDKPYFLTIDSEDHVTFAIPDITARLLKRKLTWPHVLQTESGETLSVLKEVPIVLSEAQPGLQIWVFITKTTAKFMLGLMSCMLMMRQMI
jgi:hypothetical protein